MPQGESYEKLAGVVASMERLGKVFEGVVSSSKKLKENIEKSDELFGTSNKLKDELQSAITSPVLFKKLNEVLSRNLGGTATPEIRKNLAKASAFRKQYQASNKAQAKIAAQIASKQAALPHAATLSNRQALQRQIQQLQSQHGNLGIQAINQRAAMRAALARSKRAALGKGTKLGTISKIGLLSKAASGAGIALGAAIEGIRFFDDKIRESGEIIAKYSQFSMGGAHAAILMYVRDIKRNIDSSRALSDSMMTFAKASSDMKDAWKNTNIVLDKFTLSLGTVASKSAEGIGRMFDPLSAAVDKLMGALAKGEMPLKKFIDGLGAFGPTVAFALEPILRPLEAIAKAAKWKTMDEELGEFKDMMKRRAEYFKTGKAGGLKKGDIAPIEEALGDVILRPLKRMPTPAEGGPMEAPKPPPVIPGMPLPPPVGPAIPAKPAAPAAPGAPGGPPGAGVPAGGGVPGAPPVGGGGGAAPGGGEGPVALLEEILEELKRGGSAIPDPFDKPWLRPGKRAFPEPIGIA